MMLPAMKSCRHVINAKAKRMALGLIGEFNWN
jgi:hypothetical protein